VKAVDYYFSPSSPWTFLGHARFEEIARRAGAQIRLRPVDLGAIFPQSGGLPVGKRAPQRQAYRLMELARWRERLGVPLNLQPKHFPVDANPAAQMIVAAEPQGVETQMKLAGAIMRAVWVEEKNIADATTLASIASAQGLQAAVLAADRVSAKTRYDSFTQEALNRGVFGAPTYAVGAELFWGQDRLDFVERALGRD
jgi:2-hydroxychromene-2-carboxylate isomerase